MRKHIMAVWEQWRMSQIFSGAALHKPLDEIGSISQVSRFLLPFLSTILPISTICYFVKTVKDRADELDGIILRHYFCTNAR